MRILRRWWWILPLLLIAALAGFVVWAEMAAAPMPEALAALMTDDQVQVEAEPWLIFTPTGVKPEVGLVLYPGARVDPRAYAPAVRALSEAGYQVVIVPMPLNLAFFAPDRAADVIAAFPEIRNWAVGGHSLGGAMAARFAFQNPDVVQGLVLLAAYPASTDDLSAYSIVATSIYGTHDGLATVEKIDTSRPLLPPSTTWVSIEGGNHAQFGWYGSQAGDGVATISRAQQQAQIVEATRMLLSRMAGGE